MTSYYKLAASAACIGLLSASVAYAAPQDVIQTPEEPIGQIEPNQILTPPPPRAAPVAPPPPPVDDVAISSPSGIAVVEAQATTDSLGLAAPATSGFSDRVWEYHSSDEAQTLLSGVPAALPNGTLRTGIIDLLQIGAPPPRSSDGHWLFHRVSQLARMGDMQHAARLMGVVPPSFRDTSFVEHYATSLLQSGQLLAGCKALADFMERSEAELTASLDRLRMLCMAKGGGTSKVELALSIRAEKGEPVPDWFYGLIESTSYDNVTIPAPTEALDGLDLAMLLSASGKHMPQGFALSDFFDDRYLPYYGLIGRTPGHDTALQISFLERAVLSDSSLEDTLAKRYAEFASATSGDQLMRARAAGYTKLVTAGGADKAIGFMRDAMRPMIQPHNADLASIMLLTPLKALSGVLKDNQPYIDYAPYAFAILLQAGDTASASKWVRMMGLHYDNAIKTHIAYELTRFTEAKAEVTSAEASKLPPYTLPEESDKDDLKMLRRYYTLMPLFGFTSPELTMQMAEELIGERQANAAPSTQLLASFAQRGSVAGVLLVAASLQGAAPLHDMSDTTLTAIIEALQTLGQNKLARQLAVESVLSFYY